MSAPSEPEKDSHWRKPGRRRRVLTYKSGDLPDCWYRSVKLQATRHWLYRFYLGGLPGFLRRGHLRVTTFYFACFQEERQMKKIFTLTLALAVTLALLSACGGIRIRPAAPDRPPKARLRDSPKSRTALTARHPRRMTKTTQPAESP